MNKYIVHVDDREYTVHADQVNRTEEGGLQFVNTPGYKVVGLFKTFSCYIEQPKETK